jgi:hypothetical protein
VQVNSEQRQGTEYFIDDNRGEHAIAVLKDRRHRFITGVAGSGKTTLIREQIQRDPSWGFLTATTGIAAIHLGASVPTIHSALGIKTYADLLWPSTALGHMTTIAAKFEHLIIDEASMLPRAAFDILIKMADKVGIKLVLVGDIMQLAPMDADDPDETMKQEWCFKSEQWHRLDIVRLTKSYRQKDAPGFLKGLQMLRAGDGNGYPLLWKSGVIIKPLKEPELDFPGVTLIGRNKPRVQFNDERYRTLSGPEKSYTAAEFEQLLSRASRIGLI